MYSGEEIIKAVKSGAITIDPFDEANVNPNSYNLTLGDELLVYTEDVLDCKKENATRKIHIPDDGYILSPNTLYLAETREYTETDTCVPLISGRSSIGRIGLTIHQSSGCGNIGFKGSWTLGITCVTPTKVYRGMEIGQIYFFPPVGKINKKYEGSYSGRGVKASNAYKQFEKEK